MATVPAITALRTVTNYTGGRQRHSGVITCQMLVSSHARPNPRSGRSQFVSIKVFPIVLSLTVLPHKILPKPNSQVYANQNARIADEVSAVTEISQISLHHAFHFLLTQVVKWLHERRGRQEQGAAACHTNTFYSSFLFWCHKLRQRWLCLLRNACCDTAYDTVSYDMVSCITYHHLVTFTPVCYTIQEHIMQIVGDNALVFNIIHRFSQVTKMTYRGTWTPTNSAQLNSGYQMGFRKTFRIL